MSNMDDFFSFRRITDQGCGCALLIIFAVVALMVWATWVSIK